MSKNWFDAKMDCERKGEFLATFDTVESASWFRQQQLTAGMKCFSIKIKSILSMHRNFSV